MRIEKAIGTIIGAPLTQDQIQQVIETHRGYKVETRRQGLKRQSEKQQTTKDVQSDVQSKEERS